MRSKEKRRIQVVGHLLDVHSAAQFLGFSELSLRKRVFRRSIPFKRVGRQVLFSRSELEKWIDALGGVTVHEALENGRTA
jgi:excisionase family DNA binding protein